MHISTLLHKVIIWCSLEVQREHVGKDVALRLVEAGFNLEAGDFDFSTGDWFENLIFNV